MERHGPPPEYSRETWVSQVYHCHEPRRRRTRSFGSESDWNGYRNTYHEGALYRSHSIENLQNNFLQEHSGTPKYVSSVYVKDDNYAINGVQVPDHNSSPLRYYSESAPSQQFQGIGHLNPAYASDSDSDAGRSRKRVYLYLADRKSMFLPHSQHQVDLPNECMGHSLANAPDKKEQQGHVNAAYTYDYDQRRFSEPSELSYRGPNKNRVSPDMMEMVSIQLSTREMYLPLCVLLRSYINASITRHIRWLPQ